MDNNPLAIAVRIYVKADGTTMADIKTYTAYEGIKMETIVWTKQCERERFFYNGYTLFYDERLVDVKSFEEIK